jgi:hypothetical protein
LLQFPIPGLYELVLDVFQELSSKERQGCLEYLMSLVSSTKEAVRETANALLSEFQVAELADNFNWLISLKDSVNSYVRNASRLLALKVLDTWEKPQLEARLGYLLECAGSDDLTVRLKAREFSLWVLKNLPPEQTLEHLDQVSTWALYDNDEISLSASRLVLRLLGKLKFTELSEQRLNFIALCQQSTDATVKKAADRIAHVIEHDNNLIEKIVKTIIF